MCSNFDEADFDFDLNFFPQSTSNVVNESKIEKQRQAILRAKKKTIATDTLIRKYYAQKEKLEQTENVLFLSKEECKQVCIDYKNTLEKNVSLEKDIEILRIKNQELQEAAALAQNQCDAMKSHTYQLQLLIKENETQIQALKIEKKLEKNVSSSGKNGSSFLKEKETLIRHICLLGDVVLGKKKLNKSHKAILQKYHKAKTEKDNEEEFDETNNYEEDFFDPPSSPLDDSNDLQEVLPERQNPEDLLNLKDLNIEKITKQELILNKGTNKITEFDADSECSNELVSEDTGCGSSPAFSDGDKCHNSPNYFMNDSPLSMEHNSGKNKNKINSNKIYETHDRATSPIIFDDEMLLRDSPVLNHGSSSPEYFITDIPLSSEIVTIKEKIKLVDAITSPIRDIGKNHVATSPVICESDLFEDNNVGNNYSKNEVQLDNNYSKNEVQLDNTLHTQKVSQVLENRHTTFNNISSQCEIEICQKTDQEKRCLEKNNSSNSFDVTNEDDEVEMILKKMRFTHKLVTPLPDTPARIKSKQCTERDIVPTHLQFSTTPQVCPDVAKLREENQVLHTSISDLAKEIFNIKSMVQIFCKEKMDDRNKKYMNTKSYDETSNEEGDIFSNIRNINVCDKINESVEHLEDTQGTDNEESDIFITNGSICNLSNNDDSQTDFRQYQPIGKKLSVVHQDTNRKSSEKVAYEEELSKDNEIENLEKTYDDDISEEVVSSKIFRRPKKLTKLEKFKNKLLPNRKVTKTAQKRRKLRFKPKPLHLIKNNKTGVEVLLNNKSAYEKALRVMSEIKAQNKEPKKNGFITRPVKRNKVMNDKIKTKEPTGKINRKKSRPSPPNPDIKENSIRQQEPPAPVEAEELSSHAEADENLIEMNPMSPPEPPSEVIIQMYSGTRKETSSQITIAMNPVSPEAPPDLMNNIEYANTEEPSKLIVDRNDTNSPEATASVIGTNPASSQAPYNESTERETTVSQPKRKSKIKMDTSPQERHCELKDKENNINLKKSSNLSHGISNKVDNSFDSRTTRSRSKILCDLIQTETPPLETKETVTQDTSLTNSSPRTRKRKIDGTPETYCKRILRSSFVKANAEDVKTSESKISEVDAGESSKPHVENNLINSAKKIAAAESDVRNIISYTDFDANISEENNTNNVPSSKSYPVNSILCKMIQKYGKKTVRFNSKAVSDEVKSSICKKLEEDISVIVELPSDKINTALKTLVEEIQAWNFKTFVTGLMMYLKSPERKTELYKKINTAPAPPMTKAEQVLLFVVKELEKNINAVDTILTSMEYYLFQLKNSPDFDILESMSHFYALLCRYFGLKNRLRLFILDGMYCLQFKVVPLIKQCLDVWMHVLPLAHMGIAKTPLITCMVYLLHFYKCEDRFHRVQDLRFILQKKYFYQITDWNEMRILEMFRNAIKDLRDIEIEKKILRSAIIILGKRLGARWCQKNIIKNLLMSLIDDKGVSAKSKEFCVGMLGPVLKPFPVEMKVHCEIMVNQLLDMLDQDPPDSMKEAIFTSLIYMNKHNQFRVTQTLLHWEPKSVSSDFEQLACDFVREKSIKQWKNVLPKMLQ